MEVKTLPEIIFKADQGAGVRKIIRIMQGDTRSHVIRFVVPRYESGVDLAPLVWYIRFVDAAGKADIALPSELYEVTAEDLRIRWTVRGISTNIVGSTRFQLYGAARDAEGNPVSWKSGVGEIEVTENMGFDVTEDQEQELSQLDELILYSKQELNSLSNKANAIVATAEGVTVEIYPDEGSILKPVVTFGPVITGNAAPTPTAPCTLSARSNIVITNNGTAHDGRFDEPAYGGTVDWNARTVTIDKAMIELSGADVNGSGTASGGTADVVVWITGTYQGLMANGDGMDGYCSHFVNEGATKNINTIRFGANTQTIYFYLSSSDFADAAAFRTFVNTQAALGTPVTVVFPLKNPITVPLHAETMLGYAGLNTLSVEAEAMTVAYNKSLARAFAEVWDRLNG